ncbi:homing endonuclease [Lophiostoma macrostomum CBS 122681]|uniref:Homing endonuclease n=1 Tax=Lophiostoma macrostomum CBS 122681 TaxID=1314788 RepID=A0A6A6SLA0_9PLEO|nr:homing endonuclease [Lophiostoma macrostomum CBS 122681]
MVNNRPMLINNYMNLHYMLESSNTLNTINNIISNKVKAITMSNQQVTKKNILENIIHFLKDVNLFGNLRDYTWRIILLGYLKYSPVFFEQYKLDPNWVTGFVDAEGCFSVIIEISQIFKRKERISFEINLHEKDKDILYKIKSDRKLAVYRVTNVNNIKDIIIPHFTNYPLLIVEIILNKNHLTEQGFLNTLSYYAAINKGVSKKVLKYYPNIISHSKDLELIRLFTKFFDCDITSLLHKILPHFDTYPLLNLKQEDYICFKKGMTIIKLKKHLTTEGLKTLNKLNLDMNSNRYK